MRSWARQNEQSMRHGSREKELSSAELLSRDKAGQKRPELLCVKQANVCTQMARWLLQHSAEGPQAPRFLTCCAMYNRTKSLSDRIRKSAIQIIVLQKLINWTVNQCFPWEISLICPY